MRSQKKHEYRLIVEGAYFTNSEADHALRDPFIEEWVEETGRYRIHNSKDIQVAQGVSLGSLEILMLDEEVFEIMSNDPKKPLTEQKVQMVAEALRRQDMFDQITIERIEEDEEDDDV